MSSITDEFAAYRFVNHNLYIWPAYPAADAGLWHARGSHIHFVFAQECDEEGEGEGDEEGEFGAKGDGCFHLECTILTFRHVKDIGTAEGPRGGALGGAFRFEVEVEGLGDGLWNGNVSETEDEKWVGEAMGKGQGEDKGEHYTGRLSRRFGGVNIHLRDMLAAAKWFWGNRSGASGETWRCIGEREERLYLRDWEGLLLAAGRVRDMWCGTDA